MPRLFGWKAVMRTPGTCVSSLVMSARRSPAGVRSRSSQGASDSTMKPLLSEPPWPAMAKVLSISPESRSGWISRSIGAICCVV